MLLLDNDNLLVVDIDDTLLTWEPDKSRKKTITIRFDKQIFTYHVMEENVEMLKLFRSRGAKIILWSQSGHKFVNKVAKALKLESYIDVACSKPKWTLDDLPASVWMPNSKLAMRKKNEF